MRIRNQASITLIILSIAINSLSQGVTSGSATAFSSTKPAHCQIYDPVQGCTKCENAYYLSNVTNTPTCEACPSHCSDCSSKDTCNTCDTGYLITNYTSTTGSGTGTETTKKQSCLSEEFFVYLWAMVVSVFGFTVSIILVCVFAPCILLCLCFCCICCCICCCSGKKETHVYYQPEGKAPQYF